MELSDVTARDRNSLHIQNEDTNALSSLGLNPISVLLQDMHEEGDIRLEAYNKISLVAQAIGSNATSTQLLPELTANLEEYHDEDELHFVLANQLSKIIPMLHEDQCVHHLIALLAKLASFEETVVRFEAVKGLIDICGFVIEGSNNDHVYGLPIPNNSTDYFQTIKCRLWEEFMDLSMKEMFAGRVSATLILPYVYDVVNYTLDMYGPNPPSRILETVDIYNVEKMMKKKTYLLLEDMIKATEKEGKKGDKDNKDNLETNGYDPKEHEINSSCLTGEEMKSYLLFRMKKLAKDEMPLVRKACAYSVNRLAEIVIRSISSNPYNTSLSSTSATPISKNENGNKDHFTSSKINENSDNSVSLCRHAHGSLLVNELLPLYIKLSKDDQDLVRMAALENLHIITLALEACNMNEIAQKELIPITREAVEDRSWKVRTAIAKDFVMFSHAILRGKLDIEECYEIQAIRNRGLGTTTNGDENWQSKNVDNTKIINKYLEYDTHEDICSYNSYVYKRDQDQNSSKALIGLGEDTIQKMYDRKALLGIPEHVFCNNMDIYSKTSHVTLNKEGECHNNTSRNCNDNDSSIDNSSVPIYEEKKELLFQELLPSYSHLLQDLAAEVRLEAVKDITFFCSLITVDIFEKQFAPIIQDLVMTAPLNVRIALSTEIIYLSQAVDAEIFCDNLAHMMLNLLQDSTSSYDSGVSLNVLNNLQRLIPALLHPKCSDDFLPLILDLRKDDNWRVRKVVVSCLPMFIERQSLEYFEEKLIDTYFDALTDKIAAVRRAVVDSIPSLIKYTSDDPLWISVKVVPQLQTLFEKAENIYLNRESILDVIQVLINENSPDSVINPMIAILVSATQDRIPNVRFSAATVLAHVAKSVPDNVVQEKIRPSLVELARDTDEDVKYFATKALQLTG